LAAELTLVGQITYKHSKIISFLGKLSHVYEVRPPKDKRGFDLISDVLPFDALWYTKVDHAVGYAQFGSRSRDAVIRVYDEAGNVIETHEHAGDFKEW
jgi:hypothetical protein